MGSVYFFPAFAAEHSAILKGQHTEILGASTGNTLKCLQSNAVELQNLKLINPSD